MANMTFKANLLPNSNLGYNLGSSTLKWNVYGDLTGNAATATKLATARTISLTGSVTGSGTFDGSGTLSIATTTNHSHSYLPLSGGTMTGQIVLASNGYRTSGNLGYSVDAAGNFTHLTSETSQYWHLNNGAGTAKFTVYWENGNTTIAGTCTAAQFSGPLVGNVTGNCSGSAGSVAWGNVTGKPSTFPPSSHTHSYLPLSGGTMTGTIKIASTNGIEYPSEAGYKTDSCGNFTHKRTTSTDTFNIYNNAGTSTFAHEWETGNLRVTGNLTAKNFLPCTFTSSCNANSVSQGIYIVSAGITNAPLANHGMLVYISSVGTPFLLYFPDNLYYVYKRIYSGGAWSGWTIMTAAWA